MDTINICCIVLKLKSWHVICQAHIGLILTHLTFHISTFYILYIDKLIALLMAIFRHVDVIAYAKVLSLYLIALSDISITDECNYYSCLQKDISIELLIISFKSTILSIILICLCNVIVFGV